MELSGNTTINKLIMLFVFDKMDFPIMEDTVFNLCTMSNSWISWMECKETVAQLLETGFIYQSVHENKVYYSITPDGRMCLSHFYTRIPSSLRAEITEYVKENRMSFRRKQEYFRNYYKNADGSYTVQLKIMDPAQTMLEIKLNVSNQTRLQQMGRKGRSSVLLATRAACRLKKRKSGETKNGIFQNAKNLLPPDNLRG